MGMNMRMWWNTERDLLNTGGNKYERRFVIYGNDGNVLSTPTGFPVPQGVRFQLILVTHDESTFYENDHRKLQWVNNKAKPVAEKKGEGQLIMVSEFLM